MSKEWRVYCPATNQFELQRSDDKPTICMDGSPSHPALTVCIEPSFEYPVVSTNTQTLTNKSLNPLSNNTITAPVPYSGQLLSTTPTMTATWVDAFIVPTEDDVVSDTEEEIEDVVASDCSICLNNKSSYVYSGCGHLCVCKGCARKCGNKCPICRQVSKAIRVYTS